GSGAGWDKPPRYYRAELSRQTGAKPESKAKHCQTPEKTRWHFVVKGVAAAERICDRSTSRDRGLFWQMTAPVTASLIAVGTSITGCPPHRSRRARFAYRAPT